MLLPFMQGVYGVGEVVASGVYWMQTQLRKAVVGALDLADRLP